MTQTIYNIIFTRICTWESITYRQPQAEDGGGKVEELDGEENKEDYEED